MVKQVAEILTKVRKSVPLVQAITNYVTVNDVANILLAYGASPAMVEAVDEAYDFAKLSSAIYINIGTLTKEQELAALQACISAKNNNVPVVLDPVGCAAIARKSAVIKRMKETGRIDVIKGNGGEIKFLAGYAAQARGVDSIDDGKDLLEACQELAKDFHCVVAATGKEDVITDGKRSAIIHNGSEMLTKITGAGCMAGGLCAATAGVEEDKFLATVAAITSMGLAGEITARETQGPGTFKMRLMDYIYLLDDEAMIKGAKIEWK